jgi:hypothetical protein
MEEYRTRVEPTATSAKEHEDTPMDAWQMIVANYDAEMADGKSTFNQNPTHQSVQEEYSTYVMGASSAGSTFDTLGFWKVRYFYKIYHNHIFFS